jgi:cell wall-associated NlpC family hydrolase
MCHAMADSEPYIALIRQNLVEVFCCDPLPGDLAVFKPLRSRCYSHAAIVVDWPTVIHARGVGVHPQVEIATAKEWPLAGSPVRIFTPFHATQDQ